ncbi:Imm45 family immunity protein [Rhizobium sp.]
MLLLESGRAELWRGDILRLPENYDLGPGSGPVDILVYDPHDDTCGLGLMVSSGYKAGLTWSILPRDSRRPDAICIDMGWLKIHWSTWFAYQWDGAMRVIDIGRTEILEWDRRMIVETP